MANLPGYRKLPGKSRRYETPTGETISRRQYENLKFRSSGWDSWSEYQREARKPQYRRFAKAAAQNQKRSLRGLQEPDSQFNKLYLKSKKAGFPKKVGGPFDKFLKAIGLRDPDADYPIGDSPGQNK